MRIFVLSQAPRQYIIYDNENETILVKRSSCKKLNIPHYNNPAYQLFRSILTIDERRVYKTSFYKNKQLTQKAVKGDSLLNLIDRLAFAKHKHIIFIDDDVILIQCFKNQGGLSVYQ